MRAPRHRFQREEPMARSHQRGTVQAQRCEEERLHPHGQLPRPCAEEAGRRAGAAEAELPGVAPHDGDAGPEEGRRQRRARHLGTQQGRHHGQRLHAVDRRERQTDAGRDLSRADGEAEIGQSFVSISHDFARSRFGLSVSDRINRVGRLTQR